MGRGSPCRAALGTFSSSVPASLLGSWQRIRYLDVILRLKGAGRDLFEEGGCGLGGSAPATEEFPAGKRLAPGRSPELLASNTRERPRATPTEGLGRDPISGSGVLVSLATALLLTTPACLEQRPLHDFLRRAGADNSDLPAQGEKIKSDPSACSV